MLFRRTVPPTWQLQGGPPVHPPGADVQLRERPVPQHRRRPRLLLRGRERGTAARGHLHQEAQLRGADRHVRLPARAVPPGGAVALREARGTTYYVRISYTDGSGSRFLGPGRARAGLKPDEFGLETCQIYFLSHYYINWPKEDKIKDNVKITFLT